MPEFQLPPPSVSKNFEHLICDLFNELNHTSTFKCFGKQGHKQYGIDLLSVEKDIIVQCKLKDLSRREVLLRREMLSDIEDTVKQITTRSSSIQFDKLYFVSTVNEHPDYDEYCESIKAEKRIQKDFSLWLDYSFENRTRNSKMIIHSIEDKKYPEHELNKEGKYQWFGAEIWSISHKGLHFTIGIENYLSLDSKSISYQFTDLNKLVK